MARVLLYWLPLGAGRTTGLVRWNGRLYERLVAAREHRESCDLYHSALVVEREGVRTTIEMTPAWGGPGVGRGVVAEGPVGARFLGRSRWFRYEVRCWPGGEIPDLAYAVESPRCLSTDDHVAAAVLDLVPTVPRLVWGSDPCDLGEMWNSNSVVSWLLVGAGLDPDVDAARPPLGGRAPGWATGLAVAADRRSGWLSGRCGPRPAARRAGAAAPGRRTARSRGAGRRSRAARRAPVSRSAP